MEEKPKRTCSCRLAVNNETGRVQWCIGQQKVWPLILRRLVFVPIVLLSIALILYFLSRSGVAAYDVPSRITLEDYDNLEVLGEERKRDFMYGMKTVYVPETVYYNSDGEDRKKRDKSKKLIHKQSKDSLIHLRNNVWNNEQYELDDQKNKELKVRNKRAKNQHINQNSTEKLSSLHEHVLCNVTDIPEEDLPYEEGEVPDLRKFFSKNKQTKQDIRKLQSKIMNKYINFKIDPCVDFYDFACGNWHNYYDIPPDKASYDTFEMVRENLDFVIKDTLSDYKSAHVSKEVEDHFKSGYIVDTVFMEGVQNDSSNALEKVKNFYASCMNEELISKRGIEPLLVILKELGGWPMIQRDWSDENYNLMSVLTQLRLLNNDVLISQWIAPDMKNSKEYIIHMDQASLGLPTREYYFESNGKYIRTYKEFILTLADLLGANMETATKDADEIIDFETKLAESMTDVEERKNATDFYLRTDLDNLSLYFPQFDWNQYFSTLFGRNVDGNYPIACYCTEYLQRLAYYISITSSRTLQNYVLWRFIRHRTNNLGLDFTNAKQRFYRGLFGREEEPPRWSFCISQVNSNMGMAVGALFVRSYFDLSSKEDTIKMTLQLEESFQRTLAENVWLDNHTKQYAQMKIDQMDLKIGFPDYILDDTLLSKRYEDVEIHPDYFFENALNILRHLCRAEKERFGALVNRTLWSTSPAVVNAYYSRNRNQILFPAGMLQPPFYHRHFPKAINFGGIGVVIGHEITHGFDDKGRLFDHTGNLHYWWRESSIAKFYAKAQCLIDQYSTYVLPEIKMNLDGYLTQGENIADNGGIKQSFKAYENWLKNHPDADETLPGLNLTGKQLFFLNFAQVWCGQQRVDSARTRLRTSVHAPGRFRVIGSLSNSVEFSKAFKCPKDSPMNPSNKCSVW